MENQAKKLPLNEITVDSFVTSPNVLPDEQADKLYGRGTEICSYFPPETGCVNKTNPTNCRCVSQAACQIDPEG